MSADLIQPMEVARDADGYWTHPGIPDFEEDHAAWKAWREDQGLEAQYASLESEPDTHPAYISYYENSGIDISEWNPEPPAGDGWFTASIHDTDDGPVWFWVRRCNAQGAAP